MPMLLIMKGAAVDQRVRLPGSGGRLVLGRGPTNDVVLGDHGMVVSRRHAEIRADAGGFTVIDLDSENGVWRHGIRVATVALETAEPVVIGPYRLLLADDDVDQLLVDTEPIHTDRDAGVTTPGATSPSVSYTAVLIVAGILGILGGGLVVWLLFSAWTRPSADRSFESGVHAPVASLTAETRALAQWVALASDIHIPGDTGVMQDEVGRYRLLERVGRGAMGDVYRGRGPADDDDLAVKILSADLDVDDAVRARFAREARAAASLQHRNIVRIVEASLDDDPPFIVMEFLRGRSLAARLASGPPPGLAMALDIAVQLCEGLHYAHEHGVIHRDVKPANIWLEEDGTLKLLDFGVAHIGDTGLTRHGESVGTLAYTAPEQITGGRVDRRADLFSVGAVLFEVLSGRRPFDGSTPAAMLKRVRGDVSLPVGSLPAEVPADVRAAILKATDSSIEHRYETAADLAVDLRLALLSLPASALGAPLVDPDAPADMLAPTVAFAPDEAFPPTQTDSRPWRRVLPRRRSRPWRRVLRQTRGACPRCTYGRRRGSADRARSFAARTTGAAAVGPAPPCRLARSLHPPPAMPPARPQASAWSTRVATGVARAREAWTLAVSKARLTARTWRAPAGDARHSPPRVGC